MEICCAAKKLNHVLQLARFAASVSQKRWCTLQDIAQLSGIGVYCLFWRILQL